VDPYEKARDLGFVAGLFGKVARENESKNKEENLELAGILGLVAMDKIEEKEKALKKKEDEKNPADQKAKTPAMDAKGQPANSTTKPTGIVQDVKQPQTLNNPNSRPPAIGQYQQPQAMTQKTSQPAHTGQTPGPQMGDANLIAGIFGGMAQPQQKPQDPHQQGYIPFRYEESHIPQSRVNSEIQQPQAPNQKNNQPATTGQTSETKVAGPNYFSGMFGNKAQEKPQDHQQQGYNPFQIEDKTNLDREMAGNSANTQIRNPLIPTPTGQPSTQLTSGFAGQYPSANNQPQQAGSSFGNSNPQPLNSIPTFGNNSQASSQPRPQPAFGASLNLSNLNPNSKVLMEEDEDDPMYMIGSSGSFV